MRILRLDLARVGPFVDAALSLAEPGAPGRLALVYGDNEAGKSTVLAAIRRLFFGFHHSEKLAHGGDQKQLSVGALLELASGARLEVSRRKGKGDTLRGRALAGGDEFDEAWLLAKLGHPNQEMFERIFAFSLEDLARGADALSGDHVRSVVYGAGFGGAVSPGKLLDKLRKQQSDLFGQGAAKKPINLALHRVSDAEAEAAKRGVRPETLRALEDDAEKKRAAADARHAERADLLRRRERAAALHQGLEPYRELVDAEGELATLGAPRDLPADAEARHEARVEERERLARDAAKLDDEIARLTKATATPIVDEVLAPRASEVSALHAGLAGYARARRDLPRLESELAELQRHARARLVELRPGWTLDRLRESAVDAATRADLEKAGREHEENVAATRLAEGEIAKRTTLLSSLSARLEGLPSPADTTAEKTWLEGWSAFTAAEAQLRDEERRVADLSRRRDAARLRLSPPLPPPGRGAADDAARLPVPPLEEVARFEAEISALAQKIRQTDDRRAEQQAKITLHDEALDAIEAAGHAPSEEELLEARARRDLGLRLMSAALRGEPDTVAEGSFDATLPLPRAVEESVRAADHTADAMRARADAVQKRSLYEVERGRAVSALSALDEERGRHEKELAAREAAYAALFAPCGFSPLSPKAMQAWLSTQKSVIELGLDLDAAEARVAELGGKRDAFVARGAKLLAGRAESGAEAIRAAAEQRVAKATRDAEVRATTEADLLRERAALSDAERRLFELRAEATTWVDRWARLSSRLGTDLSVEAARSLVAGLGELRAELVSREGSLSSRIEGLAREVATFEAEVSAVLPGDATRVDTARAVEDLHARAASATSAIASRTTHLARLDEARAERARVGTDLGRVDAALAALRDAAGATGDAEVSAAARRAARAAALRASLEEHARTLRRLRGPWEHEAYLAALSEATPEVARAELERLDARLAEVSEEARALDREAAVADKQRSEVDGGAAAADALALAASERAVLRDHVERYAVVTLAVEILERSIARFERDHQPALLGAASALFASMTGARYRGITQRLEGDLVVERDDGTVLVPDQLSTGTREQLFLAIRLAYVEHYARGAEPLPVVLDDVLVNFDAARAAATLRALAAFAEHNQVLLFTCHRALVDLAERENVAADNVVIAPARGRGT